MAAKKKLVKAKPRSARKASTVAKKSPSKKLATQAAVRKVAAKKVTKSRKAAPQRRPVKPKPAAKKKAPVSRRPLRDRLQSSDAPSWTARGSRAAGGGQSGDLQGLSRTARSDSESVDDLLEEGNAFEAGILEGVEAADNADGREVRTREVLEDDVPDEYLDED